MKKRLVFTVIGIIVMIALVSCSAQGGANSVSAILPTPLPPTPTDIPLVFDGAQALRHAEAQMAFGPRPTRTEASRQTGDYILAELEALGWRTEVQPFEYQGVEVRNLIGRAGEGRVVIIGAHYDTRRRADSDLENPDLPVPGANDGASGVAVLLELARVLDVEAVNAEVWLVFFDAEDNGRLDDWDWIVGSTYFADNLKVTPEYVIVADMIGDADQNIYLEANSTPALRDHLWSIASELGYEEYFIPEIRHSMLDDHTPFLVQGIPAVDIIDFDYPYWHTTEDTLDKISADSLERVGRVLEVFLESGGTYPIE
jgi:glutaminyl-peptide cyclotransferase